MRWKMEKIKVCLHNELAGELSYDGEVFQFDYDENYEGMAISLSLPKEQKTFRSNVLFPYFKNLVPAGNGIKTPEKQWDKESEVKLFRSLPNVKNLIGAISFRV